VNVSSPDREQTASANAPADLMAHPLFVRLTHWTNTVAIAALIVSGWAILLAHPRLYWGESGAVGSPALIDLPLTLDLDQSGWGRSLHFLAAWICVVNGILYVGRGLTSRHFGAQMIRPLIDAPAADSYNRLQAIAYLAVVFVLLPLVIATGLSMSPAVMAAVPIVDLFGGHQSARTVHFIVAVALVLFLIVHVVMVCRRGVARRMRRMITG
jgi:thiosulfate reductase cytochrome b subunit